MTKTVILLAVLVAASGCHQYIPAPGPIAPGTQVRAHLTVAGAIRVSEASGEPRRSIDGTLVGANGDTLSLAVPRLGIERTQLRSGFPTADTLLISLDDVETLDEERISGRRTALLAGGIGVVLAVAVGQAIKHEGGSTGPNPPPDPLKALVSAVFRYLTSPGGT